jgi:hypothetical protein
MALLAAMRAPSVAGRLVAATGTSLQMAQVVVENPATGAILTIAGADRQGRFALQGLPRGVETAIRVRSGQHFGASRQPPFRRGERRAIAIALNALPAGVSGDSLVAWWPGEGDYTDVAGGHSGYSDLGNSFTPGPRGQAFLFEESKPGGIHVPDDRAFRVARAFTIEAWMRPNFAPSIKANALDGIFGKAAGCDRNNVTFSLTVAKNSSPGGITLYMPDSTGLEVGIAGPQAFLPQDGRFHHVAATFDGAMARIYLDANLVLEQENRQVRSSGLGKVRIGHHPECTSLTLAALDEVRFFARALSTTEIRAIHAQDAERSRGL